MINIVEDISKILKYDKSHSVEVTIKPNGVTVFLKREAYDISIPIKYEYSNEVYIDNDEQEGSICVSDIDIIKNIMEYLEDYMNEIDELCNQCDWSGRQEKN